MTELVGFKVFTHDLCSPIQGGSPIWDGSVPYELPQVPLDTSLEECASGWNYCSTSKQALLITGLWPNGKPSRVFTVKAMGRVIERGNKIRTDKLTVVSELSDDWIHDAI